MVTLRPYQAGDLDALYEICLLTGDAGNDASRLHNDPFLLGHLYAAPYGAIEPNNVIVAEDDLGVAGYIVGTHDTAAFAAKLEQEWWPALREHYAGRSDLTQADLRLVSAIREPHSSPADLINAYPAHIHMNLLERLRGHGIGTRLLKAWTDKARESGTRKIHLGASAGNVGGVAFWTKSGFIPQKTIGTTVWFGMILPE